MQGLHKVSNKTDDPSKKTDLETPSKCPLGSFGQPFPSASEFSGERFRWLIKYMSGQKRKWGLGPTNYLPLMNAYFFFRESPKKGFFPSSPARLFLLKTRKNRPDFHGTFATNLLPTNVLWVRKRSLNINRFQEQTPNSGSYSYWEYSCRTTYFTRNFWLS